MVYSGLATFFAAIHVFTSLSYMTFLKWSEAALTLDPPHQPHRLRDARFSLSFLALVPYGEKNHHGQLPQTCQPRAAEVRIEIDHQAE